MSDIAIVTRATTSAPKDYTFAGGQEVLLKAVRAVFDGTSAAGTFVPALQIVDETGDRMCTAIPTQTVAAGGRADVSWFPDVIGQQVVTEATTTVGGIDEITST